MTALAMLPVALAGLTAGLLLLPVARRSGYRAGRLDAEHETDMARWSAAPEPVVDDGSRGRHHIDVARGSSAQRRAIGALRRDTEEFRAIVATSYRSGELAVIGQPGTALLYAHLAAVTG